MAIDLHFVRIVSRQTHHRPRLKREEKLVLKLADERKDRDRERETETEREREERRERERERGCKIN